MKRLFVPAVLFLALGTPAFCDWGFVLEPYVDIGGGSQDYQYVGSSETYKATGTDASFFAWKAGSLFHLFDFSRDNPFPVGFGGGVLYHYQGGGNYDTFGTELGRHLGLHRIQFQGLVCLPLVRSEGGFFVLDAGGFYDMPMAASSWLLSGGTSLEEGVIGPDYGIQLDATMGLAPFSRAGKPALFGLGGSIALQISLVDVITLPEEVYRYWAFAIGFTLPLYF